MMDLRVGQILHRVRDADWYCVQVEYVGRDWIVSRSEFGTPIFSLIRSIDENNLEHRGVEDDCFC